MFTLDINPEVTPDVVIIKQDKSIRKAYTSDCGELPAPSWIYTPPTPALQERLTYKYCNKTQIITNKAAERCHT